MNYHEALQVLKRLPFLEGGRGVFNSNHICAFAIALAGAGRAMGTVSHTLISIVWAYLMAIGDPRADHMLRVFGDLYSKNVEKCLRDYFWRRKERKGNLGVPKPTADLTMTPFSQWLAIFSSFAEVYMASNQNGVSHEHPIGINVLEKVFWTHPHVFFGSMLAAGLRPNALTVLVSGAGLPDQFPSMIASLHEHREARYVHTIKGYGQMAVEFNLEDLLSLPIHRGVHVEEAGKVKLRSATLGYIPVVPIVSTFMAVRGLNILRGKYGEHPFAGYIVEDHTAPGHNAPPVEGTYVDGVPMYGPKDKMNFDKFLPFCEKQGVPFWLAGDVGSPDKLRSAQSRGAVGGSFGTLPALSREGGFLHGIKVSVIQSMLDGTFVAGPLMWSPTSFPFAVAGVRDTVSDALLRELWERSCPIGHLAFPAVCDGKIVLRCPAEPIDDYLAKGGLLEETIDKQCLCTQLSAAAGIANVRNLSETVFPIVTFSETSKVQVLDFLAWRGQTTPEPYPVADVLDYMFLEAA